MKVKGFGSRQNELIFIGRMEEMGRKLGYLVEHGIKVAYSPEKCRELAFATYKCFAADVGRTAEHIDEVLEEYERGHPLSGSLRKA